VKTSTYARRQLNPFAAVLQVVETEVARAFSVNGVMWRIQTLANRPDHTWRSETATAPVQQFFNWGVWSLQKGMQGVCANPILDIGFMSTAAERLVALLRQQTDRLPFELKDHYERWACDRQGNPVALLDSAITRAELERQPAHLWCAGARDEQAFPSPSLAAAPHAASGTAAPRAALDYLERQVNQRAATPLDFQRNPDGTGTRLHDERQLPAAAFPETGLVEDWHDQLTTAVVRDYLDWSAPLLLTLPHLSDTQRERLERAALARATLVADLHRLFPAVANPQLIERARVEARLRRGQ
jgi:hypothetical protein